MKPKRKLALVGMGLLSSALIVSQLVMGLLIVRGGGSIGLTRLVKYHQHTGYLTVTMVLVYIAMSLSAIVLAPTEKTSGRG